MFDSIYQDLSYLDQNTKNLTNQWNITETPVKRFSFIKRLFRKLTYWLYKPMWDQQIEFNRTISAAVCDIYRIQSHLVSELEGMDTSSERNICVLEKSDKPRVIQLVSSLNYGDAVGNEVMAFKSLLREAGYVTEIFAETIHKRIPPNMAVKFKKMPKLNETDIVIYHFSSQCGLFEEVKKLKCKILLRYHNITPPSFFHGYDIDAEKATSAGLNQVRELKDYISACIPVSEFNKNDLIEMGYNCPMKVIPILIRFSDYDQMPNQSVIDRYSDGITNVLFVGRIAPNKKIEDVISSFAEYKKTYDKSARLFLVGSFNEEDKYYKMLTKHIRKLNVNDVIFPGHIAFDEVLAYYHIADVFLCLSEHEGFCVPLAEAMYFHVPIVAFDSSAIASTLGGSGVLLKSKEPSVTAEALNSILFDSKYRNRVVLEQDKRLIDFNSKHIEDILLDVINDCAGELINDR